MHYNLHTLSINRWAWWRQARCRSSAVTASLASGTSTRVRSRPYPRASRAWCLQVQIIIYSYTLLRFYLSCTLHFVAEQEPATFNTVELCVECDKYIWRDIQDRVCGSCTKERDMSIKRPLIVNDIKEYLRQRFANKKIAKMYHKFASEQRTGNINVGAIPKSNVLTSTHR